MPRVKSNNILLENLLKFLWKLDEVSIRRLKEESNKLKEKRKMNSLPDFLFFLKYNLRKEQFHRIFKEDNINKVYENFLNSNLNEQEFGFFSNSIIDKKEEISNDRLKKQIELSDLNFEILEKIENAIFNKNLLSEDQKDDIQKSLKKLSIPQFDEGKKGLNNYFISITKLLEEYNSQLNQNVLKNIKKIIFNDIFSLQKKQKQIQKSFTAPLMEQFKYEILLELINILSSQENLIKNSDNCANNLPEKKLKAIKFLDLEIKYIQENKDSIKQNFVKKQENLEVAWAKEKKTFKVKFFKFLFRSFYKTATEKELQKTIKDCEQKEQDLVENHKKLGQIKAKKLKELNKDNEFQATLKFTNNELNNKSKAEKSDQIENENDNNFSINDGDLEPLIKDSEESDTQSSNIEEDCQNGFSELSANLV